MIGVLGGTFDPIHYGHVRAAQDVLRALALDEVRIVPAPNPPHREPPVATAEQRLRMVELALAGSVGLRLDDREFRRGGPSYTVLTLESLRAELGARPLCLLLGTDAFAGIDTWHRWTRLPELAHFVVMTRPGWLFPADPAMLPPWARARVVHDRGELAGSANGRIFFQPIAPQDISGTGIREAIARGADASAWVPPAVLRYIRDNRIYMNRGT
jgi:nicotinate-nucleotide adenylyltransferase